MEKISDKSLSERYNMTFKEVFEAWKSEHYQQIGSKGKESYDIAYKVYEPLYNKMKTLGNHMDSGNLLVGANGRLRCAPTWLEAQLLRHFVLKLYHRYNFLTDKPSYGSSPLAKKEKPKGFSFLVGANGLEPLTPCTSSRCSSQLS